MNPSTPHSFIPPSGTKSHPGISPQPVSSHPGISIPAPCPQAPCGGGAWSGGFSCPRTSKEEVPFSFPFEPFSLSLCGVRGRTAVSCCRPARCPALFLRGLMPRVALLPGGHSYKGLNQGGVGQSDARAGLPGALQGPREGLHLTNSGKLSTPARIMLKKIRCFHTNRFQVLYTSQ